MENNEVVQLYLDDIIPNRFQPREVFNDQALKELAISIREHGVIQPILVRKFGEKYEIIAGERRYKASTMAGLAKIPAIIKNLDDKESSKVALIENLQRRDLTPIEEARTYQKILDLDEMTQEQLAKTMGKSQSAVSNKLRLLSLPDEIQEALLKEEISERHARSLLNVNDKNVQVDLLKEIINNKMTVRELDSKIKNLNGTTEESDTTSTSQEGGSTSNIVVEENKESANAIDSLFGNVTPLSDNKVEVLTENTSDSVNANLFNNNFDNKVENKDNETSNNTDLGVNNMNNESLFGNTLISEPSISLGQDNSNNSSSLFGTNDPTTVDINRIREQSSDINPVVEEKNTDIKTLLNSGDSSNENASGFIPKFNDDSAEKLDDNNEIIGNGLLAGMPVIQPVDVDKKEDINSSVVDGNLENKDSSVEVIKSSLSGIFSNDNLTTLEEKNDNNQTDNFKENAISSDSSNLDANINSLFGQSSNQNAVSTDNFISTNNVQLAIDDVKKVINNYKEKGYGITIEELDLDREIQLIVKFNKD